MVCAKLKVKSLPEAIKEVIHSRTQGKPYRTSRVLTIKYLSSFNFVCVFVPRARLYVSLKIVGHPMYVEELSRSLVARKMVTIVQVCVRRKERRREASQSRLFLQGKCIMTEKMQKAIISHSRRGSAFPSSVRGLIVGRFEQTQRNMQQQQGERYRTTCFV